MASKQVVIEFFSLLASTRDASDEEIGSDFVYNGGSPAAVRERILQDCATEKNFIPNSVISLLGYLLSVLLFGTVNTRNGAFKGRKEQNFEAKAKSLVGQGAVFFKDLQSL